ncbi:nuclear transport factor 2 family protein [Spinactinospora alkalitolerans]|uniref:nuclear transport factor 2 family protein n=1 Tax=Spinactinospora alkalitolerans TaxID=687207 RepID=UPI0031E489F9
MNGVRSVFLLWPFFTTEAAPALLDVVAEHARRIVYLSAMSVRDDRAPEENGFWGEVEHLIEKSGLEWTFLRVGGFATNTLIWADQIREGAVRWPYGGAARSLIDERDIAAVAVRALTEEGHAGAKYVLTGPEAVTQAEQARIIGEATGLPVHWNELPLDEAREELLASWGDPGYVDSALGHWGSLVTEPEPVTHTVEEVTGVPARTFREWAADHADAFRPLSAQEVGGAYVSLFRQNRFVDTPKFMSTDMVRIAPLETAGERKELRGLEEIMANSRRLTADYEIHGVEVEGPFVAQDRFAVRFTFDEIHVPTGERATKTKMSLYTVAEGRITREVYYYYYEP